MDYTSKTRSLQSLVKDINKGAINLSHKLQRPEGQWNKKVKTDLIRIKKQYIIKRESLIHCIKQ